ncbi:hypothetical protein [Paraburkholderia elongata]|uniref:Uncharacterized protein n=1 Tax=Paraburkholderia elongata TaxID=2675747 RepID=A0A972NLC5_9BURK|nr:hypothetical protein [Paraburkholderia elongata]NPT54383.1 hypothetical protein [Paraburkholderia elongata]
MSTAVQIGSPQGAMRQRVIGIDSALAAFNRRARICTFVVFRGHPLFVKGYDELESYPAER